MTIPNVTMRWCVKKSRCRWCGEPIVNGTPVVSVFWWNKGNPESRRWNTLHSYHPQCWIDQGIDYLNRNPYVPRRRIRLTLSKEDGRRRFLLIRRFNALIQRRKGISCGYPDSVLLDIKLTQQMVDIMLEVATVGGVPKLWAGKL